MLSSKPIVKFNNVKQSLKLLILTLILTGCGHTAVKTVPVSDFCEGRYESLWLTKKDFSNVDAIRANPVYRETMDKYTDYHAINEKEYQLCSENKNAKIQ